MAWVARKPMTVLGVLYRPRSVVPLDTLKINPALRRRLIEQRRVVPHVVETAAGAHVAEPVAVDVVNEMAQSKPQCEAHSARTGAPCKRDANGEDGLCHIHRNAQARRASNESTEG